MKEEDKLLKKLGKDSPFTVPEGYFEHLTSEVMSKVHEQEPVVFKQKELTMWDRVKPWVYMAAMFVGAALIIKVASYNPNPFEDNTVATTETDVAYDTYIDYAVSQAMMDDYSLYVYLTEANGD